MKLEDASIARAIDLCEHQWQGWEPRHGEFGYIPIARGYRRVVCALCHITVDIKETA